MRGATQHACNRGTTSFGREHIYEYTCMLMMHMMRGVLWDWRDRSPLGLVVFRLPECVRNDFAFFGALVVGSFRN